MIVVSLQMPLTKFYGMDFAIRKKRYVDIKPTNDVCANKGKQDIKKTHRYDKLIIYNVNVK